MTDQTIKDAYREGFEDGCAQVSQYERGGGFRGVNQCWEESEAKAESEKTDEQKFIEHLEQASRIVASWPAWKRNLLDKPSNEPRKPC